jgi:hypothetical protein
MKTARMIVRYGPHRPGRTVKGPIAEEMIAKGMAVDTTRPEDVTPAEEDVKPKPKPKPRTKSAGAAPENKSKD